MRHTRLFLESVAERRKQQAQQDFCKRFDKVDEERYRFFETHLDAYA